MTFTKEISGNTSAIAAINLYNQKRKTILYFSIILDLAGLLTFIWPGFAEVFDLIWAPLSGVILYFMYGGALGILGGSFSFLEELLPFTDIIPSFTMIWLIKYGVFNQSNFNKHLKSFGISPKLLFYK